MLCEHNNIAAYFAVEQETHNLRHNNAVNLDARTM